MLVAGGCGQGFPFVSSSFTTLLHNTLCN